MDKEIYGLKLHEKLKIGEHVAAIRVPGGWIYIVAYKEFYTSTFVPYNNEFE